MKEELEAIKQKYFKEMTDPDPVHTVVSDEPTTVPAVIVVQPQQPQEQQEGQSEKGFFDIMADIQFS